MWMRTISFAQMQEKHNWKVDSFTPSSTSVTHSSYPLYPLHELVEVRREALFPKEYPEHTFHYIGLQHVEPLTGDLIDCPPVQGSEIRSRSKVFRPEDVLYARLRPYLNKVYLAEQPVREGICSSEFFILRAHPHRLRPAYLRFILASEYVLEHVKKLQIGSALPRLLIEPFLQISVPVPPLLVQDECITYLRIQHRRRRSLAAEAASLPETIHGRLIEALQTGRSPQLPHPPTLYSSYVHYPLPDADFSPKRRGRKSTS